MSYVPWYACSLNFIRIIPDRLSYNGEGVFYTQRTRRKKIQGKKKKGEEQSGKDGKSGKKKNGRKEKESGKEGKRKTENDKERNGIKPQALYNHAQGFLVTKKDPAKPDLFSI